MRWTVVGARGLLGTEVVALLRARGEPVRALGRAEVDVRDGAAARAACAGADVVVNCAAWTAVDDAEAREAEAFAVNATGAQHVALGSAAAGARLVHVSTDYVVGDAPGGGAGHPEDAPLAPRSAYGRTKAAGEWAVRALAPGALVLRTAWLYGAAGPCFPRTMARLAAEREELQVVDDQVGQPTWSRDVADLLARLVQAGASGVQHATSSGATSWHGFAQEVLASAGSATPVRAVPTAAFPRPAPRPAWSVLGHEGLRAAGVAPIGDWRERWRAAAAEVLAAQD